MILLASRFEFGLYNSRNIGYLKRVKRRVLIRASI